jgi:branched-subunit amino acid ABC-type transport system permease component
VSLEQVEQLTAAGIINGSFYALLGAGFGLILGVTGRFHYAFALTFTLAAYVTSVLETAAHLPLLLTAPAGLIAAAALGVAIERWIYRPLAQASGALSLLTIFISSLGLTIAGVNLITLAWTAFSRSITLIDVRPLHIEGVTFTTLDVLIVATCWLLVAALNATLSFTDLGRSIRAARGNPYLARIMGLEPDAIYLAIFAIGSLLCGAAGILDGARYAVSPGMGIRPVVFAFVVAFLGGTQSRPLVVGLAGLLIGLIESLSGLFVSPQWSSLVVFSVLFVYLVLRPLDLRAFRVHLLSAMPDPARGE